MIPLRRAIDALAWTYCKPRYCQANQNLSHSLIVGLDGGSLHLLIAKTLCEQNKTNGGILTAWGISLTDLGNSGAFFPEVSWNSVKMPRD